MSVAPRPKFSTLHVLRGSFCGASPSFRELGRLHFTSAELNALERAEKKEYRKMAFSLATLVKKTSLPEVRVGRSATEPRLGISENGRIILNAICSKALVEQKVTRVALFFDPADKKVALLGFADGKSVKGVEEADLFKIQIGKKDSQISLGAAGFLREVAKYDFAAAGSQSFPVSLDPKWGYILTLPAETPKRKPVQTRKAKGTPVAAAPPVAPPAQEELEMNDGEDLS